MISLLTPDLYRYLSTHKSAAPLVHNHINDAFTVEGRISSAETARAFLFAWSMGASCMTVAAVILAAGHGTRMRSKLPKFLHPLAGLTLLEWSLQALEGLSGLRPVVVVGHAREQVHDLLGERVDYCVQNEPLGTGHALMQARDVLHQRADQVLVIYSDMPLLRSQTLKRLTQLCEDCSQQGRPPIALSMLTVEREESQGFGRVVRDGSGAVRKIVEEADCTAEETAIRELNLGVYCFDAQWLWENLNLLAPNVNGEYYLTDMVGIATEQGLRESRPLPPCLTKSMVSTTAANWRSLRK